MNFAGETKPITSSDVLVVSPYNMQVSLLKRVLPDGAGVEFLFSPNRLNVAISRAQCLSRR